MAESKSLARWHDRIFAEVQGLAGASRSGFRLPDPDARAALIRQGFPGVLPLWAVRKVTVGLISTPSLDPLAWRGIVIKDGNAVTLSADALTLLPRFLLVRFLANDDSALERLASEWPGIAAALSSLHLALGGSPAALEAVASAVRDPAMRRALSYDADHPNAFQAAMSEVARRVDPSPEFTSFANWLDDAIAGNPKPIPDPSKFGAWARFTVAWARKMGRSSGAKVAVSPEFAGNAIESFAGLDTAVPGTATWDLRPGAGYAQSTLAWFAEQIDPKKTRDPIVRGLAEALREDGTSYDGYAHAEAVAALDEGGEPERAWGALHSAAWWMAQAVGEAPPAILDGARLLCDRHGWDDLRWMVDRNAGSLA